MTIAERSEMYQKDIKLRDETMQRIVRIRETRKCLFQEYGTGGMAVIKELSVKLSPFTLQEYLMIALNLPPIDCYGKPENGDFMFDYHQEILKKIRMTNSKTPTSISIDVSKVVGAEGASLLQLLVALCYQVHIGAINRIWCVGTAQLTDDLKLLHLLLELFPNVISLDAITWQRDEDFEMFGKRMSNYVGDNTLLHFTIAGTIDQFLNNIQSFNSNVNCSYISDTDNGLSDEDLLGEVRAILFCSEFFGM
jgi:hypothetical protein